MDKEKSMLDINSGDFESKPFDLSHATSEDIGRLRQSFELSLDDVIVEVMTDCQNMARDLAFLEKQLEYLIKLKESKDAKRDA